MILTLTETALDRLKSTVLKDGEFPRIDADITGGCGMAVKFTLVFDEQRRNDTVIEYDGIQFRIDSFTKRYLDEEMQVHYTDEHGFLIGESFASGACAIEIS